MKERLERQRQNESQIGEEIRSDRLAGAAETSKERAEWRRLQQRNLNKLGLLKIKRVASEPREQLASMRESPLPKEKGTEPSVQSTRS